MSAGKTDIWMPVYIGDYLADTMRVSTEQHGGYLLLLFHLWRRGILPDDVVLAQITGLGVSAWSSARQVLGEFFKPLATVAALSIQGPAPPRHPPDSPAGWKAR